MGQVSCSKRLYLEVTEPLWRSVVRCIGDGELLIVILMLMMMVLFWSDSDNCADDCACDEF